MAVGKPVLDELPLHLSLPRTYFCSSIVQRQLFVWGGTTTNYNKRKHDLESTVCKFDQDNKNWSLLHTTGRPPSGLIGSASAAVDNHLYVYGGRNSDGSLSAFLHQFNIDTREWRRLSAPIGGYNGPRKKEGCGMVYYGGKLVIFGGHCGNSKGTQLEASYENGRTNELHTFDLKEGTWSSPRVTGTRPPPCDSFSLTKTGDHYAVLFGGNHSSRGYTNDVYILNLKEMHWQKLKCHKGKPWPPRRNNHAATCIAYGEDRPQILVTGGLGEGELDDMWMLDMKSGTWKEIGVSARYMRRFGHCAAAFNIRPGLTEIAVIGGETLSISESTTLLRFEYSGSDWICKNIESQKMKRDLQKKQSVDEDLIKGIERAIAESGGKINRKLAHVMFVGPPGSGKSSLMDRLLGKLRKRFPASTGVCDAIVTVDINVADPSTFHSVMVVNTDTWEETDCTSSFMRQISDSADSFTTGQETHSADETQAQFKAPDVSRDDSAAHFELSAASSSLDNAQSQPIQAKLPASMEPVSSSLPNPRPVPESIQSIIKKHYGHEDFDLWSKTTSSLYLRDTGGQVEFQEMLALLISGPSIFVFVFRADLGFKSKFEVQYRKSANETLNIYTSSITTEEALLQCLSSVYAMDTSTEDIVKTHQPLVFIVATHIDKLGPEREVEITSLDKHLDSIINSNGFSHLVQYANERARNVVFAIDNTSESEESFRQFRSRVNHLVNLHNKFNIEYPISYLFFCLELQEIKKSILTLKECTDLAARYGITGKKQVSHLLRFLHIRIGLIRYFDVPGIQHIIVREPQVLFKKTTDLIVKTFSSDHLWPGQITDFEKRGILTVSALESVMSDEDKISPREFLQLLVHLRITAPFHIINDQEERYFLPCVLNHVPESTMEHLKTDIAPLCVSFKCSHCPKGIYGVLVTHLMRPEGDDHNTSFTLLKDKIFKDQVSFEVHSLGVVDEIVLKLFPSNLEISFFPDSSDERDSPIGEVCNNVREIIGQSISRSLKNLHYKKEMVKPKMCFKCEHCGELHPVMKGNEYQKIHCGKIRRTSRIPLCGRCWFNEDHDTTKATPSQDGNVGVNAKVPSHAVSEENQSEKVDRSPSPAPKNIIKVCSCSLLKWAILMGVLAIIVMIIKYTGKGDTDLLNTRKQKFDPEACTEIEGYRVLKEVLDEVSVSGDQMCRDLDIPKGTCNDLATNGGLSKFRIADKYIELQTKPCWEKIIHHLCKDFKNRKLAKEVADKYNILGYSELCKL